jgi:DNA modification methylase
VTYREHFPHREKGTRPPNVYFKEACEIPEINFNIKEHPEFDVGWLETKSEFKKTIIKDINTEQSEGTITEQSEGTITEQSEGIADLLVSEEPTEKSVGETIEEIAEEPAVEIVEEIVEEAVGGMEIQEMSTSSPSFPSFPYFNLFTDKSVWDQCWANLVNENYCKLHVIKGAPKQLICESAAYNAVNILTNHYSEEVRMKAKIFNRESPIYYWQNNHSKYTHLPLSEQREAIWKDIKEATLFNCALSKCVYQNFTTEDSIVLDPFMGWGDRMLGALALRELQSQAGSLALRELQNGAGALAPRIKKYIGFDINADMEPVYEKIKQDHDPNNIVEINICDFLEAKIPDKVDLVFTSPPYFDYEIYSANDKVQDLYKSYEMWISNFLTPAMKICVDACKDTAKIMIHIGETNRTIKIGERLCGIMKKLGWKLMSEIECYNESSMKKRYVPIWYFVKNA